MPDVFVFAFAIVIIVIVLIFPIKVAVNISEVTIKFGKCPVKFHDPFFSTHITNFSYKSQDF